MEIYSQIKKIIENLSIKNEIKENKESIKNISEEMARKRTRLLEKEEQRILQEKKEKKLKIQKYERKLKELDEQEKLEKKREKLRKWRKKNKKKG